MATKVFKGKFIDELTFVDEDGNILDLIPSVLEVPKGSDQPVLNDFDDGPEPFEWNGPTDEVDAPEDPDDNGGKDSKEILAPRDDYEYVDNDTGEVFRWDPKKEIFYDAGEGVM